LPDVTLSAEQLRVLAALESYDLSPVRATLVKEGTMPASWVDPAILEFRRYLALLTLAETPVFMLSRQVDDVWHACLSHSRLYADFCDKTFGWFVHHEPGMPGDLGDAWTHFASLYRRLFGEPAPLWQMWRT
jgi:hypothetical protein